MATSTLPEIHIEMNEANTDDPLSSIQQEHELRSWLQMVDDHIDKSSLEIMKLGLQGDVKEGELEKAKSPSDLYNILTKSRLANKHDSDVILARFVYALEILGHRRHGFRAVRKLKDNSIKKPTQYSPTGNQDEIREFNFFQCLVQICVHLDNKHYQPLFNYSTKIYLSGINPSNFNKPTQLLTRLLHERIITTEDQNCLVEVLEIVRADKCIEYIHRYRHMNNLSEITGGGSTGQTPLESGGTMRSTASSTTDGELTVPRSILRKRQKDSTQDTNLSRNRAGNRQDIEENVRSDPNSRTTCSSFEQTVQQSAIHNEQQPQNTQPLLQEGFELENLPSNEGTEEQVQLPESEPQTIQKSGRMKVKRTLICGCSCFIFLVGVFITGLFATYGVEWSKRNKPMTLKCYENTTVILTEVHHLFTLSLNVTEDTNHVGDFYRHVEIYQLDSKCNELPTRMKSITFTNNSEISSINGTTFYALAGSSIQFDICAVTTNYTMGELERLELIVYKDSESQPDGITYFHVGTDGEWQCKESKLDLKEPGYYTINFLPPTHEARFVFNATYNVREIDTEQLQERALKKHMLQSDQDNFVFSIKFRDAHSCFVATIEDNERTLKQTVHIQMTFMDQKLFMVGIGLLILAYIIIMIVVSSIALCTYMYRQKQTQ